MYIYIQTCAEEEGKSINDMTPSEKKLEGQLLELELRLLIDNMKANIPLMEKASKADSLHSTSSHTYVYMKTITLTRKHNLYIYSYIHIGGDSIGETCK